MRYEYERQPTPYYVISLTLGNSILVIINWQSYEHKDRHHDTNRLC